MENPTVLFNSVSGSDTAASGAGPATAQTGTKARAKSGSGRVGFYEASKDLSGVDATGLAVLWVDTSSGRQYSKITAVKSTEQSVTGDMDSGTNPTWITNTTTTGITAGDSIRIAGAGAAGADLYTVVSSVDAGVKIVVADACSTTVDDAAVDCPQQVTTEDTFTTLTSDTVWAIGGKRATITHADSRTLFADAKGGWIIELEDDQAVSTSAISCTAAGTTATGLITLRGNSGNIRVITQSANAACMTAASGWYYRDLGFENSNATKTAALGLAVDAKVVIIERCRFGNEAGTNQLLRGVGITSTGGGSLTIENSGFFYTIDAGIQVSSSGAAITISIDNCVFRQCCQSAGTAAVVLNANPFIRVTNSVISHTASSKPGISLANNANGVFEIIGNTISNNGGDGILGSSISNPVRIVIRNNQITTNSGYGINISSNLLPKISYNNFGTGATANTSGDVSSGLIKLEGNLNVDPGYTNAASYDFSIGTATRASASPPATENFGGVPTSGSITYVDIGAIQRIGTASGLGLTAAVLKNAETVDDVTGTLPILGRATGSATVAKETGANARGGSGNCIKFTPTSESTYGYVDLFIYVTGNAGKLSFYYKSFKDGASSFNGTVKVSMWDSDDPVESPPPLLASVDISGTYDETDWYQYQSGSKTHTTEGLARIRFEIVDGSNNGGIYIDDIAWTDD